MSYIPKIFSQFKNVTALQTTRTASVEIQLHELGIAEKNLATSKQVHGKEILFATTSGHSEGFDAIITNEKNIFVAVKTADCVPVLIYDAATNSIAAIHAGWRGTVLKIVSETLQQMQKKFGTEAKNCYAYIGTCISECSFEVGGDVAEKFYQLHNGPEARLKFFSRDAQRAFVRWDEEKKKYFVDLKKANKKQLTDFGIPGNQIEVSPFCTVVNNDKYFSYRKENAAPGRMLSVIGVSG